MCIHADDVRDVIEYAPHPAPEAEEGRNILILMPEILEIVIFQCLIVLK